VVRCLLLIAESITYLMSSHGRARAGRTSLMGKVDDGDTRRPHRVGMKTESVNVNRDFKIYLVLRGRNNPNSESALSGRERK
jgi:hypothetical protein